MRLKPILSFGLILAIFVSFSVLFASPARAACDPLPTDKGSATTSVTIKQDGQYTVWLRMVASAADRDSVALQIDDQCAVVAGNSAPQSGFYWVNYQAGDTARPIRFNLTAGAHSVILAGHEAGGGVDKVLFASDPTCTPVNFGENCLTNAEGASTTSVAPAQTQEQAGPATTAREIRWWVIALSLAVVLLALGVILWRYLRHLKKVAQYSQANGVAPARPHTSLLTKLRHFWQHDKVVIFICGAIIIAATLAGAVFASDGKPEFEVEKTKLEGGAKVVQDQAASGGEYVVFEKNPPGTTSNPGNPPQQNTQTQTGGGTNNQGNTGGGSSEEDPQDDPDEEPTPAGQCAPFPAFPDDTCTGWQHTGVTLQTCTEGDGDEGDGHLELGNTTYDGCDFADGAVVHSPNITIKRSRIQGVVSAHWSTDYDFQNLTLIDVEIIAATPSQIAAKNMVNNGGGSALNGANVTCIRCRIHYVPTGISLGNGSTIQDSYISDVTWGPGAHQAAIGAGGNSGHNSVISHNRLDCSRWNTSAPGFEQGCSSALSLYDEPTLNNVLVQNNLFDTAGGYCTYGGGPQGTNIRYLNNRFGKKYNATCGLYGAVSAFYSGNTGNVWSGNSWLDGSGAVNP